MAEAVKVALIRDAAFFEWLEAHAPALAAFEPDGRWPTLVRRCAELHLRHIATGGDPFELGSARPLDFGHWAAHKLETLTAHALRHGEAVAIGIGARRRYSVEAGLLAGRRRGPHRRAARAARAAAPGTRRWTSRDGDGRPRRAGGPRGVPRAPRRRAHA